MSRSSMGAVGTDIGPADRVACADLWRPPVEGVGGEYSWAEECVFEAGGLDGLIDFFGCVAEGIWLLEEGVGRFDWGGEEDDAFGFRGYAFDDGSDELRRGCVD
jgi:hypothetical protein